MPRHATRTQWPSTAADNSGSRFRAATSLDGFSRDTKKVDLVPLPQPGSRPYGIVVDSKGHPWIAEFGTNKLATVDPGSLKLTEFELPDPDARPRRLVVSSKDEIWFVDYALGTLGRFDPRTSQFKQWPTPGGPDSRPYGMAIDKQDRIWFVETGTTPNRFVGFNPAGKSISPWPR